MLKALPPKGHKLDAERPRPLGRRSCASRIDKLGVSEPEIRKQGTDQIVIELAGVTTRGCRGIIGKTAQLELYDLEADAHRPVEQRRRATSRSRRRASTTCSPRQQSKAKQGSRERTTSSTRSKQVVAGPVPTKAQTATARRCSSRLQLPTQRAPARSGRDPRAARSSASRRTRSSSPAGRRPASARRQRSASGARPTTTSSSTTRPTRRDEPDPGDDRQRPEALGHAGRLRPADGPADRADAVHRQGQRRSSSGSRTRAEPARPASLRQTPQHFAIVLDREIRSFPQIDYTTEPDGIDRRQRRADHRHRHVRRGEEPRARAADRRAARQLPQLERTDVSATLGKDSLQQAKRGRDRRAARRRALPAPPLPLPRPRRGDRARDLRRPSCTRRSSSSTSR